MKRKRLTNREWVYKASKRRRYPAKKVRYDKSATQFYRSPEVPVPRSGLGNKQFVKLVYSDKFVVGGSGLGTASVQQYQTSSLFDPDLTNVGHQPLGLDQMSALFEKYIVTQMEYKITITNSSASQSVTYAITTSDSASTTTNIGQAIEQGNSRIGILTPATGGLSSVKIAGIVKNWVIQGQTYDEYMGDGSNEALMSASPPDVSILNLYVADSGTGTCPNVYGIVELVYYAWLRGSVLTSQS